MNLNQHLNLTRKFLGHKGNPEIHRDLDFGTATKFEPQYHKLRHNPRFIQDNILPIYGEKGSIEAWLHLLADWGFFNDYIL